MRTHIAVVIAKAVQKILNQTGSGGGAMPGLIAERIAPGLLTHLTNQAQKGVILIAGTNGKTTTTHLLTSILKASGTHFVTNRSGSNMARGHLSALLASTGWNSVLKTQWVVLEVDEAVLPNAIKELKPVLVVWNNLFRDQLDRYGEVDSIAKKWLVAIQQNLPASSTLLINGDDPLLVATAQASGHKNTCYFGLDSPEVGTKLPTSSLDAYVSPISGKPLQYSSYYVSHLGEYFDPGTSFHRPPLDFAATQIQAGTANKPGCFTLKKTYVLPLPGLYNIYNALAACAISTLLHIDDQYQITAIASFDGVFGRFERIQSGQQEVILALIKNPAGAGEVLRTITADPDHQRIVIVANDNFADGLDVSWYWDTEFEQIAPSVTHLCVTGTRALDMALRWKYAGFVGELLLVKDVASVVEGLPKTSGRTYILATYTAMLQLQKELVKRGLKTSHWKE